MPVKTSSGKWKWGNVERDSKKELVQTVYGIWKKNGSKGSFSDFLKGTHESVELDESAVELKHLYFHGTSHTKEMLREPSPLKPFFITKDISYALSYITHSHVDNKDAAIYVVFLNPRANVFDPTNSEDIKKLEELDFWPKEVIDRLKSGADVLMVMEYAAKQSYSDPNGSKMAKQLHGTGAKTHREEFCKQLKMLGFDMFKTAEDSLGYSSNLVYGVISVNGLDSLVSKPISVSKAEEVSNMVKHHRSMREIRRVLAL